jgi:DNA-binding NarL/FixJ family response regulator
VRILIVDDHEVVREGLRQVMSNDGAEAVDQAGSIADALAKLRVQPYSAVLLDMSLPDGTGLDALREIRRGWPRLPVLVVSMHPEEVWALRAVRAGANGYLNKSTSAGEIAKAVRKIVAGGRHLSVTLTGQATGAEPAAPDDKSRLGSLSDREFEVLRLLGSGKPVGDVARLLDLSVKTVSTHREHILQKLGFSNNMEIIRFCLLHGLLGDPLLPG